MRVFLIVIDSFGIGEMPDAAEFGDVGSNTYKNIYKKTKIELSNLKALGLNNIDGVNLSNNKTLIGNFARLAEITKAKDTTAGHYELAGIIAKKPYPVFPNAFPTKFVEKLEKACKTKFLGNQVASGTQIIKQLGQKHIETKKPILYTSQDSVLQIAAHDGVISLERLYEICEIARKVAKGKFNVARVIARPFTTVNGDFERTINRKDFALDPPKLTMLDKLSKKGFDTISVGKIFDVFNGRGITKTVVAKNNLSGLNEIEKLVKQEFNGLVFANLVDTDMLFGHRNDALGYANALKEIDEKIGELLPQLKSDDVFLITADHGCDPTTPSTDHSREYVPLLVYSKNFKQGINLGTIEGFNIVSLSILDLFGVEVSSKSLFRKLV